MSQVTQITIDNVAFGTFRSNLNDTLNALNSMHSGTSRPASATTGTIWLDTTNAGSNSLTIKFFDGTDDITVADVDTSANTINFIDSTVSTELLTDLSPQLGGMLDVNGNAIGNGTEELIKFSETASAVNEITVTNSATGNAPEISATGDDTNIDLKLTPKGSGNLNLDGLIFPNADGTTGQFLKTDGSGNLSFDTVTGGENTPAFMAYVASGGQSVTAGTPTKMPLTIEILDTDSAFDSSTNYRFTVPSGKGGYYNILFGAQRSGWASNRFEAMVRKNGTSILFAESYSAVNDYTSANASGILNLSAGDYIELFVYHNGSGTQTVRGSNTEVFTYMGGFKLIGA